VVSQVEVVTDPPAQEMDTSFVGAGSPVKDWAASPEGAEEELEGARRSFTVACDPPKAPQELSLVLPRVEVPTASAAPKPRVQTESYISAKTQKRVGAARKGNTCRCCGITLSTKKIRIHIWQHYAVVFCGCGLDSPSVDTLYSHRVAPQNREDPIHRLAYRVDPENHTVVETTDSTEPSRAEAMEVTATEAPQEVDPSSGGPPPKRPRKSLSGAARKKLSRDRARALAAVDPLGGSGDLSGACPGTGAGGSIPTSVAAKPPVQSSGNLAPAALVESQPKGRKKRRSSPAPAEAKLPLFACLPPRTGERSVVVRLRRVDAEQIQGVERCAGPSRAESRATRRRAMKHQEAEAVHLEERAERFEREVAHYESLIQNRRDQAARLRRRAAKCKREAARLRTEDRRGRH